MTRLLLDMAVAAALMSLAALALESALRAYRRPTRGVWAGAMAASIALPLVARLAPGWLPPATELTQRLDRVAWRGELVRLPGDGMAQAATWDGLAIGVWIGLGVAVLAMIGWSLVGLARERRGWRRTSAAGMTVWRSRAFGPAAVGGALRSHIVLPEWVFTLGARQRRCILVHEGEHVRAGDVFLLLAGLLMVALVPWNLLLWWQFRRLRAAVEMDCDRRVLGAGVPMASYAAVLLSLPAARRPIPGPVLALATPRSLLGRRIDMMTRRILPLRALRASLALSAAFAAILAACEASAPPTMPTVESTPKTAPAASAQALREQEVVGELHKLRAGEEARVVEMAPSRLVELKRRVALKDMDPETRARVEAELRTVHEVAGTENQSRFGVLVKERAPSTAQTELLPSGAQVIVRSPAAEESKLRFYLRSKEFRAPTPAGAEGTGAPLILVDGAVWTGGIRTLEKSSFDKVEVVKGDAARARYGERGANGVIVIRTKP